MPLSEAEYETHALGALRELVASLDELDLDDVEAELASDILTIEFADGARYVVNSHRAARQIWLAAERSAWHFDWEAGESRWVAHKSGDELFSTLERLLSGKLGRAVRLAHTRLSE
jgi:iron-sulfur cluster assembly protein CyaY